MTGIISQDILKRSIESGILSVMKMANFVTFARKIRDVLPAAAAGEVYEERLRRRKGKRIDVAGRQADTIFRRERKKHVRIEYTGPTKIDCIGCGVPFLFLSDGQGRYPEYHSNACKQKAYRKRKKTASA
jgi:hypothetical protein